MHHIIKSKPRNAYRIHSSASSRHSASWFGRMCFSRAYEIKGNMRQGDGISDWEWIQDTVAAPCTETWGEGMTTTMLCSHQLWLRRCSWDGQRDSTAHCYDLTWTLAIRLNYIFVSLLFLPWSWYYVHWCLRSFSSLAWFKASHHLMSSLK